MIGLGLGLTFIGYSLTYYGITQIRGGNWGLLDLMVPARWAKAQSTPTDSAMATPSTGPAPVLAPPGTTTPVGAK